MKRFLAARVNAEGRIEKYADYDTAEQAAAHNTLHGQQGNWMVLDNNTSVPLSHIKVVNFEVTTEIPQEQLDAEANEYTNKRKAEYPEIGDQLDDLYKQGVFSAEMTALIKAVKDKYPKP